MRIVDISTISLRYKMPQPYYDANYEMATKPALLVQVHTDEGIVGTGEAAYFGGPLVVTRTVIEKELKEHVLGQDPLQNELIWDIMHQRSYKHGRGGVVLAAMSGIDIALWDIKGKVAGLPVYKLLGGYCNHIRGYATGGFYAPGKDLRALADEVRGYLDGGLDAVKIKVGRSSQVGFNPLRVMPHRGVAEATLAEDIERVQVARQVLGRDGLLMVDANCAWDVPTALHMARELAPYGIFWLEEPVSPDDLEGSARVAAAIDIPVAGYETCTYGRYGFRDYIQARAVYYVQPDVAWCGGITEALKIAHLAAAWHLPVAPHIHGSAVATAAALHFMGGIPNASLAEVVFPRHPLTDELTTTSIVPARSGYLTVPEAPGLGVELNRDTVERYRVEE